MNKNKFSDVNVHSPYRTRSGKVRQTQTQNVSVDDSSIVNNQFQLTSFSRSESMQSLSQLDQTFTIERCNENEISKDEEDATLNNALSDDDEEIKVENNDHGVKLDYNFLMFDYEKKNNLQLLMVPTQQYQPKLCDNGFFYTVDKFDNQLIYWKLTVDHNHEPDPIKEEVYVYTTKILARACLTNEDPR
ncbi:unnamed protein product, partial [Brachionus calyciflorus]